MTNVYSWLRIVHPSRRFAFYIVLFALLTSCAPAPTPTPAPEVVQTSAAPAMQAADPVVITFGSSASDRSLFEPHIEAFNAATPDIRVQFVSTDNLPTGTVGEAFDPNEHLRAVLSVADTTTSNVVITPEAVQQGLVKDLTPFIDADPSFQQEDFFPGTLNERRQGEIIYLVPRSLEFRLMQYNKDLWNEQGLVAPPADWSLQTYLDTAARLAQTDPDGTVTTYGIMEWHSYQPLFFELQKAGIDLFATPVSQVRLTTPEAAAALAHVATLVRAGVFYRTSTSANINTTLEEMMGLVRSGRVAMFEPAIIPPLETLPFESGHVLVPPVPWELPGTTRGYVMSGGTQHPEAAWRWLSFLSRQNVLGLVEDDNFRAMLPARASVAEQIGSWQNFDAETRAALERGLQLREAHQSALPNAAARFALFGTGGLYNDVLGRALDAVIEQRLSPEQALAEAEQLKTTYLERMAAWGERARSLQPLVVATPVAQPAATAATRITFGVPRSLEPAVRQIAEQFNQQQAAVQVQVRASEGAQSINDIAVGNDCFAWLAPPSAEEIISLLDLRPFLDADATLPIDAFPPALLAAMQRDGTLYGLPWRLSLPTMGYNPALLDQAGQAAPTADASADQILALVAQLSGGSGQQRQYGYASATGNLTGDVRFWLGRLGAELGTANGNQTVATLTDPQTVAATRAIVALLRDHSPHATLTGYSQASLADDERGPAAIQAGQVGLWVNQFTTDMSPSTATWTPQVAPIPLANSELTAEDVGVSGLYIKVVTPHVQACWQWLVALSEAAPATTSGPDRPLQLAVRAAVQDQGQQALTAPYEAVLAQQPALTPVIPPGLDPFWFYRAVDRALQGADLERELADAQFFTEQYLACVQGGEAGAACARQVDPSYNGWQQ